MTSADEWNQFADAHNAAQADIPLSAASLMKACDGGCGAMLGASAGLCMVCKSKSKQQQKSAATTEVMNARRKARCEAVAAASGRRCVWCGNSILPHNKSGCHLKCLPQWQRHLSQMRRFPPPGPLALRSPAPPLPEPLRPAPATNYLPEPTEAPRRVSRPRKQTPKSAPDVPKNDAAAPEIVEREKPQTAKQKQAEADFLAGSRAMGEAIERGREDFGGRAYELHKFKEELRYDVFLSGTKPQPGWKAITRFYRNGGGGWEELTIKVYGG